MAREIGVPSSLILYHFGSLEGLFEAVLKSVVENARNRVQRSVESAPSGHKAIEAWVDGQCDWFLTDEDSRSIFLQFYAHATQKNEFAAMNARIIALAVERVAEIIRSGVEAGEFSVTDIELAAEAVHGFMTGAMFKFAAGANHLGQSRVRRQMTQIVLRILGFREKNLK